MRTSFKKSFAKDLKAHSKNKSLLARVEETILQVESAVTITDIKNLKKLKVEGLYYRIKIGDYRKGLTITDNMVTFVRVLHRKEIYRFFP